MYETKYEAQVCFFSPFKETVCSSDNPAGRDERATTEEAITLIKDSGEPRLRLYRCEGTTHDFIRPLLRPLTACQRCKDTKDESASAYKGKMKKKGVTAQTAKLPESSACWGGSVALGPAEEQKQILVIGNW